MNRPAGAGRVESGRAFPWRVVIGFGLAELGLSPLAFWSLTLPELAAALARGAPPSGGMPTSAQHELRALIDRFPDRVDKPR